MSKRIEDKLDKLDERLDAMSTTLAVNTESLKEHMKRTAIIEQELKPVKAHVQLMNALAKVSIAAVGIYEAAIRLF
jgi:chromosome segregation ATPase